MYGMNATTHFTSALSVLGLKVMGADLLKR
jgi:hypothetical protein